jgi:hypothetical protein
MKDQPRGARAEMPAAAAPAPPPALGDAPVSRAGFAVCLLTLSFATVLFTLAIFKLLSFFIMPSLFFDLLFIGFPLGAFLGAAFFQVNLRSFLKSLWWLQAITVLSVAAVLVAKNFKYFDYLRAHLFDVEVSKLLFQMATFTGLFLPFFAVYGLSEYIGYQLGRRALGGRMRWVYALYLFGAAAAYILYKLALTPLGIVRILALALLATAVAIAALGARRARAIAGAEALGLAAVLALPAFGIDLEGSFLFYYKGRGDNSTWWFEKNLRSQIVFQKWGRYSLCEIMATADGRNYFGFYNDFFQWEYARGHGFGERSLGMVPLLVSPPGSRLAIIGSGGGRQVQYARRVGHTDIIGIEIEPAVFEAVNSPEHLLESFDRVYLSPGVTPVRREARGFMEEAEPGSFDLIYLPSVGGYPQMMMEPGNLIRTHEAYETLMARLSGNGILAIWYPRDLDEKGILTAHYVRTLRALGLKTLALENPLDYLILAYKNPQASLPSMASMVLLFLEPESDRYPGKPRPELLPREVAVADDPLFRPITDDRPFLAGNVRHILSVRQVYELWAVGGGVLLASAGILLAALRRRGDPAIPRRSYWQAAGLTILIGANFLMMEHFLVLALFRRTFIYYDSLMLGAIGFLILSGVGSMLSAAAWRRALSIAAALALAGLLAFSSALPAWGILALMAPVALATGTYFPALFDAAARNPLAVFALDAIGAGLGTLLATFVPITWGFGVFFAIAAAVFAATALLDARFHRGLGAAAG